MWNVTLTTKKEKDSYLSDSITFEFETALEVANFIEKAVQSSVNKLEINVKFYEVEEGLSDEEY